MKFPIFSTLFDSQKPFFMRIILLLMHTILLATIKYIFSTISFDAPFI